MKRWFVLAALAAAAPLVLATAHPATAQTAEQLEQQYGREAMAQALDVKRRFDLYGIHFETGQAAIQQESQSLLDDIAAVMKQFPDWRLEIVGHTDAAGDPAQNEALSRARADAVKAALVQRGIEAGRLEPQGMGEAQPVASNDTPEGRALNRRVELVREDQKPNILFIMGDDIGWMQPSIYHRGLMVGETPNIDRIGQRRARCSPTTTPSRAAPPGATAFFTGMNPLRVGMTLPEIPGSPSYLRPGTPALAKFLLDLGYTTGEFGKNHLGDHTDSLPTAHGFQEYWGYLYHLDAMQGVSFPDINKSPTEQTVAPPCKNTPIPGLPEVPGAVDPETTTCLTPPRPVIWCKSSDGSSANQTCQDQGPLTLERSKTVDEEISAKVIDFLDRNDPAKTNKPFFVWYNPARMHITTVLSDKYYEHGRRARRQGLGRQRGRHEADGRQYRLRARQAAGDGPARQHHRRVHHRQWCRDDHLPRRRHDALRGRQADHLGRRHACTRWSSAGRATSSRARSRTTSSRPWTGCPPS